MAVAQLSDNGKVVIIGGGPGGTACALALQRLSAQMGRQVQITLLEGKQFTNERHYNQCVGVLSPPLPRLLEENLQVSFPYDLCRTEIKGYVLHCSGEDILLDDSHDISYAMRRVQFDEYMLNMVKERGIEVQPARAVDLEFRYEGVTVYSEGAPIEAEVVVGAFGLDDGSLSMFSRSTHYQPPQVLNSLVTKYIPDENDATEFGNYIHAFLPGNPHIEFGAITPKCSHLTINIAGIDVNRELMDTFLTNPVVQEVLPALSGLRYGSDRDLVYFKGRFPVSLAQNYYGHRYVMVGDAAGLVRAFKGKGVSSAVQTGIRAAEAILEAGVTTQAFHEHYRVANQDIINDLPFGRFMRLITILMARANLMGPVIRAAKKAPLLESAILDAVSARAPYSEVLKKALHPSSALAFLKALIHM